tara:strand:+ start:1215 stop:1556 length:342 start_codon:yes stop_codon:yes gene_type:complete
MGQKKKESEYILERKRWALDSLECSLSGLETAAHDLRKKIASNGISGNYSMNSDILRWAQRIHSREKELHLLSDLLVYCEPDYGRIEQLGKEVNHDQEESEVEPTEDSESSCP